MAKWLGGIGALLALGLLAPSASAVIIYDFTGTCTLNCASIGLTDGDAVSGTVGAGAVDMDIGSGFGNADILDTADVFASGYTDFQGTSDGSTLSALTLEFNGANLYESDSSASPQWFWSHTSGLVFPQGNGTWTRQAAAVDGAYLYDFVGTCTDDCETGNMTAGDAVSGVVSGGFVDLSIGTDIFDTMDPFADGVLIQGVSDGSSLLDLRIEQGGANLFFYNEAVEAWEVSLSLGGFARFEGEWLVRGGDQQPPAQVPEPSTLALLLLGLGLLALRATQGRPWQPVISH